MPSSRVRNTITGDVGTVLKKHGFAQNSVLGQSQHTQGRTVLTGLYPLRGDAPAHRSHVAGGKKSSGPTGLQQPPLPTGRALCPYQRHQCWHRLAAFSPSADGERLCAAPPGLCAEQRQSLAAPTQLPGTRIKAEVATMEA